jgi:hypothetical protein
MSDLESNAKSTYEAARELARDLGKLGAAWVRYGISVGQSSMQTSARTLDDAARALGKVADRLRNNG